MIAGGVVAPATAHAHVDIDPLSRECKEATAAAKRGAPIPHMDRFVFSDNENALVENTLYLYAPDRLKPHINRATAEWVKATNELVRFEYVDKPGYKVVTVQEANLGGSVGRVTGNVHNMRVLINPDTIRGGHEPSITMTLAHEIGHAMGLAHSCDGALMKVGNNRGKSATTPQALDAQVLIQHNNLKQYGGRRPQPSTTAAPAPAPVEPTTSEPAPVVPQPSTPEPSTPEVSTVVTTVPATTTTEEPTSEEPTTETTVIETVVVEEPTSAEPTPEETTKVAPVEELPKPTTLQEALDAVKEAKDQYVAADEAARAAQKRGEGIDEAEAAADAAWSVLQAAQNNLEEFKAQHPDATLEPEPQPTSEVTTKPEVTTPRSTTTAKATTSAPTTTSTTSRTSTTSPTLRPTPTTQTQATKVTTTTKLSEVAPSTTTQKATTTKQATSSKETTVTTTPRTSAVTSSSTPQFSTKTSTTKVTPTTKPSQVTSATTTKQATPSAESKVSTSSATTSAQLTVTTTTSASTETTTAAATTVVGIPEGSVVDKSTSAPTTITESLEIPTGKEDGSAKSSSTSPLAIIVPSILLVLTGLGAVGFYLYKHYF